MTTAIVDYGSGNLHSAEKSFARMAAETGAGAVVVTADPEAVRRADRVVLPGVGAFGDCAAGLRAVEGMVEALEDAVRRRGAPFFGICVGMQLMMTVGRERGEHAGLGWLPGAVEAIRPTDPALKIPHMGWNTLTGLAPHALFDGVAEGDSAYFVHSFHRVPVDDAHVLARTDYAGPITAMVGADNLIGAQFHPEKSQRVGLRLIGNFLRWRP